MTGYPWTCASCRQPVDASEFPGARPSGRVDILDSRSPLPRSVALLAYPTNNAYQPDSYVHSPCCDDWIEIPFVYLISLTTPPA